MPLVAPGAREMSLTDLLENKLFCEDRLFLFESPPSLFDVTSLTPGPGDAVIHRETGKCLGTSKLILRKQGEAVQSIKLTCYHKEIPPPRCALAGG